MSRGPGKGDNIDRLRTEGDQGHFPHENMEMKHMGWSDGNYPDNTSIGFESDGAGGLVMYRTIDFCDENDSEDCSHTEEVAVMHIPVTWLTKEPKWLALYNPEDGKRYFENWLGSGR